MIKLLQVIAFLFLVNFCKAQFETIKDSVVQIYGVVMTTDSLKGIGGAYIKIKGQNRGTISSNQGVFSIAAYKGDVIEFTHVNYKGKSARIPTSIEGNQYSILQLMTPDTNYNAEIIIKRKPTKEEFARDFVNNDIPDDEIELARKNLDAGKRAILSRLYARDGTEGVNATLRGVADRYYYNGQMPPQRILSVNAWREFISAWKRGDFKRKKK
jgi:hypothetical protein